MTANSFTVADIRRKTYKDADAWWTVFVVDPVAARLLWGLVRVRPTLSPMTVTASSLILGLASGVLFATGSLLPAAVIYQLSFLMDCVDGKLARLQGRTSRLGEFFDGFTNHAVYLAAIGGLAWHLAGPAARGPATDAGALLAVGLLALRVLTIYCNQFVVRPSHTWAPVSSSPSGWLGRNRLLPPFSFPDKHAILFLAGPLMGLASVGVGINVVLELALLGHKIRTIVNTDRSTEVPRSDTCG